MRGREHRDRDRRTQAEARGGEHPREQEHIPAPRPHQLVEDAAPHDDERGDGDGEQHRSEPVDDPVRHGASVAAAARPLLANALQNLAQALQMPRLACSVWLEQGLGIDVDRPRGAGPPSSRATGSAPRRTTLQRQRSARRAM